MLVIIKSFIDSITQALKTYEVNLEKQLESNVIHDKKDLKKASNITEEILMITDKYINWFDKQDRKQYLNLKKKFLKVN